MSSEAAILVNEVHRINRNQGIGIPYSGVSLGHWSGVGCRGAPSSAATFERGLLLPPRSNNAIRD